MFSISLLRVSFVCCTFLRLFEHSLIQICCPMTPSCRVNWVNVLCAATFTSVAFVCYAQKTVTSSSLSFHVTQLHKLELLEGNAPNLCLSVKILIQNTFEIMQNIEQNYTVMFIIVIGLIQYFLLRILCSASL